MDKVHKHNSFNSNTPSSESYKNDLCHRYGPDIYPCFRKLERLNIQLAKTVNHITFLTRCKSSGIIPIGLRLKTPFNSHRTSKFSLRAIRALLRDRIYFCWAKKSSLIQLIRKLEDYLRGIGGQVDQQPIFTAPESSFRHASHEQKINHIRKFPILNSERVKNLPTSSSNHKKFVINLSKHVLSDSEEIILKKGLNFRCNQTTFYHGYGLCH
jgi:hypothetical protein